MTENKNTESKNTSPLTLVLGGTGKTGSRVAERLTKSGRPVRIGSRSAAERPFDWESPDTWPGALEGVERVYVAGREIVRDGKLLGIDFDAVEAELLTRARAEGTYMHTLRPVLQRSQATLASFFKAGGHRAGSQG